MVAQVQSLDLSKHEIYNKNGITILDLLADVAERLPREEAIAPGQFCDVCKVSKHDARVELEGVAFEEDLTVRDDPRFIY